MQKCEILKLFVFCLLVGPTLGCLGGIEVRQKGGGFNSRIEKHLEASVVQIVFYDSTPDTKFEWPASSCSAIFLSNSGFLLTSKHCVDTLDIFKPNNIDKNDSKDWANYYLKQKVKFRLRYNDDDFFTPLMVGPIVVTGASRLYTETQTARRLVELTDSGQGPQADWLIVQVDKRNSACLVSGSEKDLLEGAVVWHLGFPSNAQSDPTHIKLVATRGHIRSQILDRLVKSQIATVNRSLDQMQVEILKTQKLSSQQTLSLLAALAKSKTEYGAVAPKILTTGIIADDAVVEKGMSGGAAISPEGNLLGVNMLKDLMGSEDTSTSAFLPIPIIKRSIELQRKKYPSIPSVETIFNCNSTL